MTKLKKCQQTMRFFPAFGKAESWHIRAITAAAAAAAAAGGRTAAEEDS